MRSPSRSAGVDLAAIACPSKPTPLIKRRTFGRKFETSYCITHRPKKQSKKPVSRGPLLTCVHTPPQTRQASLPHVACAASRGCKVYTSAFFDMYNPLERAREALDMLLGSDRDDDRPPTDTHSPPGVSAEPASSPDDDGELDLKARLSHLNGESLPVCPHECRLNHCSLFQGWCVEQLCMREHRLRQL